MKIKYNIPESNFFGDMRVVRVCKRGCYKKYMYFAHRRTKHTFRSFMDISVVLRFINASAPFSTKFRNRVSLIRDYNVLILVRELS